jgi:hypothetical protein
MPRQQAAEDTALRAPRLSRYEKLGVNSGVVWRAVSDLRMKGNVASASSAFDHRSLPNGTNVASFIRGVGGVFREAP